MAIAIFVGILILAILRPKWVFPLLVPLGTIALVVVILLTIAGALLLKH